MVDPGIKDKIDSMREAFRTEGLSDPLDVIDQVTCLMFVRELESIDDARVREAAESGARYRSVFDGRFDMGGGQVDRSNFRWSRFRLYDPLRMLIVVGKGVFPFMRAIGPDSDIGWMGLLDDAALKIRTPEALARAVEAIEDVCKDGGTSRADAYEYLLSSLPGSRHTEYFYTPRHIVGMMLDLVRPRAGDSVCDPCCGTAGFLAAARDRIVGDKECNEGKEGPDATDGRTLTGYDSNKKVLRMGAMNMISHGIEEPRLRCLDSLSDQNGDSEKYDLVLADTLHLAASGPEDASRTPGRTSDTAAMFVTLFIRMLRAGGRCACIVPDSFLHADYRGNASVRQALVEDNCLEGVITLPQRGALHIPASVLVFTKTGEGGTDAVWFYGMAADGFTLDLRRKPTAENDIPDVVTRFRNPEEESGRDRTEKSFMVPKEEIAKKGYDLSMFKYKRVARKVSACRPSAEIADEMVELGKKLCDELQRLRDML
jgi:type I restriction enzyme M protein